MGNSSSSPAEDAGDSDTDSDTESSSTDTESLSDTGDPSPPSTAMTTITTMMANMSLSTAVDPNATVTNATVTNATVTNATVASNTAVNLLNLPYEIRQEILRNLLLTDRIRVEHTRCWRPVTDEEIKDMAYDNRSEELNTAEDWNKFWLQWWKVENTSYKADVSCRLETSIMRTCRQLYTECLPILGKNKFAEIAGLCNNDIQRLQTIGNIPMFARTPVGLRPVPDPTTRPIPLIKFRYSKSYHAADILDGGFLVCLEDFPLVCRLMCGAIGELPLFENSSIQFNLAHDAMASRVRGLADDSKVQSILERSVLRYLASRTTRFYFWNQCRWDPTEPDRQLEPPATPLEEWFERRMLSFHRVTKRSATPAMYKVVLAVFNMAESRYQKCEIRYAIALFVLAKELMGRFARAELRWTARQSDAVRSHLRRKKADILFRLACLLDRVGLEGHVHPNLENFTALSRQEHVVTQWAYIHASRGLGFFTWSIFTERQQAELYFIQARCGLLLGHSEAVTVSRLMAASWFLCRCSNPSSTDTEIRNIVEASFPEDACKRWGLVWQIVDNVHFPEALNEPDNPYAPITPLEWLEAFARLERYQAETFEAGASEAEVSEDE